jgi:SAM-dependent methyltransferase
MDIQDKWSAGDHYEPYVGRWSRLVAKEFIEQLDVAENAKWLDVGCGTGALSQTILETANPSLVHGIDRSPEFVEHTSAKLNDVRAAFKVGDAEELELENEFYDAAVSGLVINFLSRPDKAIAAMKDSVKPGGTVAAYVWDYAGKMEFMRCFWDVAVELNPDARELDEANRFPLCQPVPLLNLFADAGLQDVSVRAVDVETKFRDFNDFWTPFLGGQGPAPSYLAALTEEKKNELREHLRTKLPAMDDRSIHLIARAWMAQGRK